MVRILLFCVMAFASMKLSAVDGQSLMTPWGKRAEVQDTPPAYPRPQLVRARWQPLNGLWQYAIRPKAEPAPQADQMDGTIRVPFPVESRLSGVGKPVHDDQYLWYFRRFTPPSDWSGERLQLNLGAVDWHAAVWVNGQLVGEHRGGYDPFSFDITDALSAGTEQELLIRVDDPTDRGTQPRGKQIDKPHGIWYTPTTGIWQTVWLEPVPQRSIQSVLCKPDMDAGTVSIAFQLNGTRGPEQLRAEITSGGEPVAVQSVGGSASPMTVAIPKPKLWSPDSPHLYDLRLQLVDGDQVLDSVDCYFAMRKISLGPDDKGVLRLLLNNRPLFQYGLLDQGFWPDGLYAAPSDEALRFDLEVTKRLGFNMIRKHVKVEPARWYHHCDQIGLLVWQDMPSGDRYIGGEDDDIVRTPESARQYKQEWQRIIESLAAFPSIVMWVPFNEGWGQFDTKKIVEFTRQVDPTRLVNSASGWTDRGVGDVHDIHVYPGPGMPPPSATRALVLGEFGGLGLPLEGHTWQAKDNWGYQSFDNKDDLNRAYLQLLDRLRPLIGQGLSAAVYTQTTDVEIEVNGIMTYDRQVVKLDESRVRAAHRRLFLPPPKIETVVPTSLEEPQPWRFTTTTPAKNWMNTPFDDSDWQAAPGGFGEPSTPGSRVRTSWTSPDIWLRRKIVIPDGPSDNLHLWLHHDEDAEIYVDGQQIAQTRGYTTDYLLVTLDAQGQARLTPGEHVLAVHCRQTGGGQYLDVGIVRVTESPHP